MFQIEVGFIILLFFSLFPMLFQKTSPKTSKKAAWQRMEHILPLVAEALGPITDLGQKLIQPETNPWAFGRIREYW